MIIFSGPHMSECTHVMLCHWFAEKYLKKSTKKTILKELERKLPKKKANVIYQVEATYAWNQSFA